MESVVEHRIGHRSRGGMLIDRGSSYVRYELAFIVDALLYRPEGPQLYTGEFGKFENGL